MLIKKDKIIMTTALVLILALFSFLIIRKIQGDLPISNMTIDTLEQAYELSQNIQPQLPQESNVTFLAVGDISLSRGIAWAIDKNSGDANYPFANISDLLKSTDFNFGNLETPFSSSDKYTPKETLVFNAPKKNVAGLQENNFKILTGLTHPHRWS